MKSSGDYDEIYGRAVAHAAAHQRISTSLIQREFAIGYGRAAQMMKDMEGEGIVTEADHLGKRDVLIKEGQTLADWRADKPQAETKPTAKPAEDVTMTETPTDTSAPTYRPTDTQDAVSSGELRSFVERIERLQAEGKEIKAAEGEVYAEAKGRGYATKYIRGIVKLRTKKPSEIAEDEAMMDLYQSALGMSNELPLFSHVQGMGIDTASKEAVIEALKLLVPVNGEVTIRVAGSARMRISRNKDGVQVDEVSEKVEYEPTDVLEKKAAGDDYAPDVPDVDDAGAFALGQEARKEDVAIIANPFPYGDDRRRKWDEGWRDQDGGDGMGPGDD